MPRGVYPRKVGRTSEIRGAIKALRTSGWSYGQIGKLFEISKESVVRIINENWNPSRERMNESLYVTTCARCGSEIRTTTKEGRCSGCGGEFRLVWPGETKMNGYSKPEPTISEKEDLK